MKVSEALRQYLDQYAKIAHCRTDRQVAEEESVLEIYANLLDDAVNDTIKEVQS